MNITTKGRYGLRAVLDIAASGGIVSVSSVAERQGISERYLEQLMSPLKKAGIVKSIRGAQGGYMLTKNAADISAGEILRVLEGSLYPTYCQADEARSVSDNGCLPTSCEKCAAKTVWDKIYDSVNKVLESISIEELIH